MQDLIQYRSVFECEINKKKIFLITKRYTVWKWDKIIVLTRLLNQETIKF